MKYQIEDIDKSTRLPSLLAELLIRAKCGCVALDCRHHGACQADHIDLYLDIMACDEVTAKLTQQPFKGNPTRTVQRLQQKVEGL